MKTFYKVIYFQVSVYLFPFLRGVRRNRVVEMYVYGFRFSKDSRAS